MVGSCYMHVALLLQLLEQVYDCNVICLDILSSLGHMTITACHLSAKQKKKSLFNIHRLCLVIRHE